MHIGCYVYSIWRSIALRVEYVKSGTNAQISHNDVTDRIGLFFS